MHPIDLTSTTVQYSSGCRSLTRGRQAPLVDLGEVAARLRAFVGDHEGGMIVFEDLSLATAVGGGVTRLLALSRALAKAKGVSPTLHASRVFGRRAGFCWRSISIIGCG
jgi:hypothetical protein